MASRLIASVYIPATGQTKLQLAPLTIYFRLNSKKKKKKGLYYSYGVCVCMFNNHDDNWKHGAEDPL